MSPAVEVWATRSTASTAAARYGWGVTLYLLGFALATQVAQIADGLSAV